MTRRTRDEVLRQFEPLFSPQSVAIVGASATSMAFGNEMIRYLERFGFGGTIHVVHPSGAVIEGRRSIRGLAELPEVVDYAFIGVAAAQIPAMLRAAAGKVRFAQVMSSGFGEIESGRELQADLLAAARDSGIRVLGPNCLGSHVPAAGITFVGDADRTAGRVGIVSQSGGLAVDLISRGAQRGIRYRAIVTMGNSADLEPSDLLEFYLHDPDTDVIGLYLEDVKDGRRFVDLLRQPGRTKPVAILLGGQTDQGRRAAASHTGSLAADFRIWQGLARQSGLVLVDTLDRFLNVLLAFQHLRPAAGKVTASVALFGNGGGTSVLAADACARAGLAVPPLSAPALAALQALALPPGTSVANPVDTPGGTLRVEEGRIAGRILDILLAEPQIQAVIVHVNLPVFLASANQTADVVGNLITSICDSRARNATRHLVLVLRSDGSAECDARARRDGQAAQMAGIPVFPEMPAAAQALADIAGFERWRARTR